MKSFKDGHSISKNSSMTPRGPSPTIASVTESPTILKEEVKHALSKMQQGKATGPDGIPVEVITALEDFGITEATKLMNTIYDTREIPVDMKKSIFIGFPKKPGTTDCAQHRTINLMSHLTKFLLRIIMTRIRGKVNPEIAQTQLVLYQTAEREMQFLHSKPSWKDQERFKTYTYDSSVMQKYSTK